MIEIQSLGGIALKTGDGEQVRLRSRKHTGLLLYLAMSRHRLFRREHLTSLFWTTPPDRARHSLSQAVYDLRTHLDGVLIRGPGEQLSIEGRGLSFDALEFEAAVKEGRLAEAIDLYRGPFAQNLEGAGTREFDRWVESERLRLQRLAEVAFRRYTGECESKGRWGEMCVAAMRLTEMTPLDEDAHMCLMRGLWLHGDAAAALRHYGTAIEYLARELPEGPSDRLSDLADRIRSAPSANPIENRVAERETPFLGRDREFDLLRSALHGMGTSRTTAVLIAGEAGIGKSRIVREFGRMVALEDVRLIESRCYPAEEELPYGPIVDAISPIAKEVLAAVPSSHRFARLGYLLPDFPKRPVPEDEGVDPAAWRRRLYEEIASLLRLATERRPIVWIIDDAQWIDATSAGLLHYVSRRLEGTRFLLVVTVRAPRIGRLPAKLPVTPPDGSGFTREIRLPPLTDVEIRELVLHGRPEAAEHPAVAIAQRLSAGNPFYALEVFMAAEAAAEWAQTLVDWDPLNDERLRHVLAVRFKGLPKEATRLLQCVAVLERNATPRMVAAVSGMALDAAADESGELYARGLLHDDEERLDFVNDVMRDYVYGEMSGLRRTSLHYRAGKQLELEPNPNPGILARHFHLGDDRSRAYRYAMEAARTASESGGHAEAAVMAGLARSTATDLDEELAALRIMAESELASAQLASAREHFSEIMRLQPEMIAEEKIRIQLRMVECSSEISEWDTGRAILQKIRSTLITIKDKPSQVIGASESMYFGLKIAIRQSDSELAAEIGRSLEQLSEDLESDAYEIGDEARVSLLSSLSVYAMFFVSHALASRHLNQATTHLPKLGQQWEERIGLLQGLVAVRAANWDAAGYAFQRIEQLVEKRKDLLQLTAIWNNQACSAMEQGKWDEVEESLAKAETVMDSLPDPLDVQLPLLMNRATASFYQGKLKNAEDTFRTSLGLAQTAQTHEFLPQIHAWRALVALQRGDLDLANQSWAHVREIDTSDYKGAQELYHVEWLKAFMEPDKVEARRHLVEAANSVSELDRANHLKLRWLAEGHVRSDDAQHEQLRRSLVTTNLGWFVYFSRRWGRAASGLRFS